MRKWLFLIFLAIILFPLQGYSDQLEEFSDFELKRRSSASHESSFASSSETSTLQPVPREESRFEKFKFKWRKNKETSPLQSSAEGDERDRLKRLKQENKLLREQQKLQQGMQSNPINLNDLYRKKTLREKVFAKMKPNRGYSSANNMMMWRR